jgi:hypothetical protein
MIPKPIVVKTVKPYVISVKYEDNTEGIWDVSYLLNKPVFKKWADEKFFSKVHIDKETFSISWDEDIELCPDTLYLNIRGLSFEQWQSEQMEYAADK